MMMSGREREDAMSGLYALGVLAGQVDLKRLKRTLTAEHAEAKAAGVGSSPRFLRILEVLDAAIWLDEATRELNDAPSSEPAPAPPVADLAKQADAIPDDWAPAGGGKG